MLTKFYNSTISTIGNIIFTLLLYLTGLKSILQEFFYKKTNHLELKDKSNHVAIVTGGSNGIGKNVVEILLKCNMDVVIACRNVEKGLETLRAIRASGITEGKASIIKLDFKSLKSVCKFVSIFRQRYQYLNLLVNNAGSFYHDYQQTDDGFEMHFGVNYLAHFLLTHLLLSAMQQASLRFDENPRIVNVSSVTSQASRVNFHDINMKLNFYKYAAYSQSKLCQIIFTKTLDRYFKLTESPIQIIAVDPGIVNTNLFDNFWITIAAPWIPAVIFKSPKEAAETIAFCCIDDATETAGGSYYINCKPRKCNDSAENVENQEKLYHLSIKAVENFLPKIEHRFDNFL